MEFEISWFLFLLPCFAMMFIIFSKTRNSKPNLPPGPRKFPIIGNLHLLASSKPTHHILTNLAKKYGPLMHLQLGEIVTIIVSSAETAKPFMKTHDVVFASRPSLLATEINFYGNTDIAFSPYGEYWRQLRKICTLELLTAKRVRSFRRIREEEVLEVCKWIALNEGTAVGLTERLSIANLNIMARAAFGRMGGEVATLTSIIGEAHDFVTVFNVVDVYPSSKFLRFFSGMRRKIEKHHRILDRITEDIIEERKQGRDDHDHDHDGDLLDVLLKWQGDRSLQVPLTTENIKSVLLDGFGVESSTTTVDWAFAEMLKNPRILKKAQDEVRKVFDGKNGVVDESYFEELNYLKLVIKETLRLHPPGPLLLPRQSSERCQINGYEIPARSWVLVNAWAIGRDPKYWEDAESFKPERFLEKSVDFKASSFDYIPFGAGRRICPGISFGIANIEIQLAMLLYHFDWILPNGIMGPSDVDMSEFPGILGRRKCGLSVVPVVGRSLPENAET